MFNDKETATSLLSFIIERDVVRFDMKYLQMRILVVALLLCALPTFARRMGIQRQNVNVLFKTNNLETIARAADVLDVPLALLVGYVDEQDVFDLPVSEWLENVKGYCGEDV